MLLTGPSANDVNCPMGIYLNGTPVTVVELCESSALPEWNSVEGEPNWASVLIAGDGDTSGIPGWMPLRDLVYEKPADALPTATLAGGEESGFTTLYTLNHRESDVAALERDGTGVTVLGHAGLLAARFFGGGRHVYAHGRRGPLRRSGRAALRPFARPALTASPASSTTTTATSIVC